MFKIDGVRRAAMKVLRRKARGLADNHPNVYGAIFNGRKREPTWRGCNKLQTWEAKRQVTWQAHPSYFPVLPDVTIPVLGGFETEIYGPAQDHVSVVFYGDPEGYRRFFALADEMHDLSVEYSGAGTFARVDGWSACAVLLGYLIETAREHNDGMPIVPIEGTIEDADWYSPVQYNTIRPSLTRSVEYLISGALARGGATDPNVANAKGLPAPRRRGDLSIAIEGRYLALARHFSIGKRDNMPTQVELARYFGCNEGVVCRVIRNLKPGIDASLKRDRSRQRQPDD